MQTPKKSTNISSTTGRSPTAAMPTAAPMNAASEIGLSRTRCSPKAASNPCVVPHTPPILARSSPRTTTDGSADISRCSASFNAREIVNRRLRSAAGDDAADSLVSTEDMGVHFLQFWKRRLAGKRNGGLGFCRRLRRNPVQFRGIRNIPNQPFALKDDRMHRLRMIALGLGPIFDRITDEVPLDSVRLDLHQRWPQPPTGTRDGVARRSVDEIGIVVRHEDAGHPVRRR